MKKTTQVCTICHESKLLEEFSFGVNGKKLKQCKNSKRGTNMYLSNIS